jgi:hypothetical protein
MSPLLTFPKSIQETHDRMQFNFGKVKFAIEETGL